MVFWNYLVTNIKCARRINFTLLSYLLFLQHLQGKGLVCKLSIWANSFCFKYKFRWEVLCLISRSKYRGFIEVCKTQYFIYSFRKNGPTKDKENDVKIPRQFKEKINKTFYNFITRSDRAVSLNKKNKK